MLADSPESTVADLGALISKDTALSTRLLRLVNSAYFGFARKIDSLPRAVNLIGMRELCNLTLAVSAAEVFGDIDSQLIDMSSFWQHSVYCGLIARHLAEHTQVLHSERLFTAGLLHDVGRLLMLMKLPDEMSVAVSRHQGTGRNIWELELEQIGFNHAEAGGALLQHWNLPANLCASVRYHHEPENADDAHLEAAILYLADLVTHTAQESWRPQNPALYDRYRALLNSGLNPDTIAAAALGKADAGGSEVDGHQRRHCWQCGPTDSGRVRSSAGSALPLHGTKVKDWQRLSSKPETKQPTRPLNPPIIANRSMAGADCCP